MFNSPKNVKKGEEHLTPTNFISNFYTTERYWDLQKEDFELLPAPLRFLPIRNWGCSNIVAELIILSLYFYVGVSSLFPPIRSTSLCSRLHYNVTFLFTLIIFSTKRFTAYKMVFNLRLLSLFFGFCCFHFGNFLGKKITTVTISEGNARASLNKRRGLRSRSSSHDNCS